MQISPITLTGNHIRLEPLSLDHLDSLCAIGLEPELWRWTTTMLRSCDDMRVYLDTALRAQAAQSALPFATVLKETGQVVGSSRFGNIDKENRRLEIGWYDRARWALSTFDLLQRDSGRMARRERTAGRNA